MEVAQIVSVLCLVPLAALIFKIPELGLVLCLVVGALAKGIIQPFLGPIDITAYLFAVTYGSIFIRCCMEKKLALPDLSINIGALLLVALLLASLVYTPLLSQGTDRLFRFVFLNVSLLYATFMWCNNIVRIKRLFFILSGILIAYATAALIWVFLLGYVPASRAFFSETSVLGVATFLAVGSLVAFILRDFIGSKYKKFMLYLLMIVGVIGIVASNSRGPLIAFLVGGICLFFLYSIKEKRRIVSLGPIASAVIVLAFALLPSDYTNRYLEPISSDSSGIAWRLAAWQFVMQHFHDWFFTGAGVCGFAYYYAGTVDPLAHAVYPHNIFLDFFATAGFFGLLVFVWLVCSLLYKGIKMVKVSKYSIHLLSLAAITTFIVFLTEHLFSGSICARGLWFSGGLILSLERLWRNRSKESTACALEVKG